MRNFDTLVKQFENSPWVLDEKDVKVTKRLGMGASGVTYLGDYRGEKVAVKTYSAGILTYDVKSVKNEVDIMSQVRNKNVVQFRGILLSKDPPSLSMVTKFAERGELGAALYSQRLVRRRGDALRFKIVIGLAEGLQHLHSRRIIHRDIKPANILLDDDYEPLLTDFGFSRCIEDPSVDMTGETGSYRYMAPEVTRHAHYSEKADVFSFALICNEVFTDEKPYEFQIAAVVALEVVQKNMRPSQKKIKNERLRRIIARCWSTEADERPGWDEVIAELKAAQQEGDKKSGSSSSKKPSSGSLSSLFRKKGQSSTPKSSSDLL